MRVLHAIGTAAGLAAIGIVAFAAVLVMLVVAFLVAARWLFWFCAGLLLTVYALGSVDGVRWFWLAFLIPMFVGGLVDAAFALVREGRQPRGVDAR